MLLVVYRWNYYKHRNWETHKQEEEGVFLLLELTDLTLTLRIWQSAMQNTFGGSTQPLSASRFLTRSRSFTSSQLLLFFFTFHLSPNLSILVVSNLNLITKCFPIVQFEDNRIFEQISCHTKSDCSLRLQQLQETMNFNFGHLLWSGTEGGDDIFFSRACLVERNIN